MTITYPLSLPAAPQPAKVSLSPADSIGISPSPFTGQQEVFQWPLQMWTAKITWDRIVGRPKAEPLLAMLTALKGQYGTFYLGDPLGVAPRGSAGGTPLVNGTASPGASTLAVRGFPANAAGVLLAGDYLQIGSGAQQRLYKVLADVDSDDDGSVTLDIWPNIRDGGYTDGTPLVLQNAAGTFRLASNGRAWSMAQPWIYTVEIDAMEAL